MVQVRQHLYVVGHDQWGHTETITQGLCDFRPTVSQKAAIVPLTPAARGAITAGRVWSPATFPSSSVARYSSPLGVSSTIMSGIRSSSLSGEPSPRRTLCVRHVVNSWQNTVTGGEGEILAVAKNLILQDTLYVNPLLNPLGLASVVPSV